MDVHYAETQFGFEWGAAKVARGMLDGRRGWVILLIDTPKAELQVYVTKTGKVRVFDARRGELLPVSKRVTP